METTNQMSFGNDLKISGINDPLWPIRTFLKSDSEVTTPLDTPEGKNYIAHVW